MADKPVLGILVGGGPAPGINGVISAATIEACNHGMDVLGFYDGFEHLIAERADRNRPLSIGDVSRIHFQGGSILRTSRANPTKKPGDLEKCVETLRKNNVSYMITIGGDDTAFSSRRLSETAGGTIKVAHVPKTIDNDLPLPPSIPTFGFETARSVGVELVRNLMADAKTASRWYLVVAMGRKAGHLALGIGKAAAAHLTLIPEEFEGDNVTFSQIADIVEGSIVKRRMLGQNHGVAILAEGLVEKMDPDHVNETFKGGDVEFDEHGHIRLETIEFGRTLRKELKTRFAKRDLKVTMVSKNLGYELRCADPIPFDREYTRDLGYGAVRYLLDGNSGGLVTMQGGVMKPIALEDLADPATGRPRVRMVDVTGEAYHVARKYMIRLEENDFDDDARVEELAKSANMSPKAFRKKFEHLAGNVTV